MLGAYGVISQLVANREREFALRLVFGAAPRTLGSSVLLQTWRLTIPGIVLGSAAAWFASSALLPFTFGIDPRSLPLIVAVALGVLLTTGVAALGPAWRARRVRPDRALAGA
jgi:ABC-type antimicrobial peptide transport system permease subunit